MSAEYKLLDGKIPGTLESYLTPTQEYIFQITNPCYGIKRFLIQCATGSGKSFVMMFIAMKWIIADKTVVFITKNDGAYDNLIENLLKHFRNFGSKLTETEIKSKIIDKKIHHSRTP